MDTPRKNSADGPNPGGGTGDGAPTTAAQLRRTVAAAATGQASRQELESAAGALVVELRARNEPPERVLLHIKEILAEAGLRPTYASGDGPASDREANLYRDVIAWCIHRYYNDGPARA